MKLKSKHKMNKQYWKRGNSWGCGSETYPVACAVLNDLWAGEMPGQELVSERPSCM
jgi:hypothetical protein